MLLLGRGDQAEADSGRFRQDQQDEVARNFVHHETIPLILHVLLLGRFARVIGNVHNVYYV